MLRISHISSNLHSSVHKTRKSRKIRAGKGGSSSDDDDLEILEHKGKKSLKVLVKHEFPLKESPITSESSLTSAVKGINVMSEFDKLARQRDTLNQLLLMTTEDSSEWKMIKTKIKANLYRELSLLEEDEG